MAQVVDTEKDVKSQLRKVVIATPFKTADGSVITELHLRRPTGGDIKRAKRLCRDNGDDIQLDLDNYLLAQITHEAITVEDLDAVDGYDLLELNKALQAVMGKPESLKTTKK